MFADQILHDFPLAMGEFHVLIRYDAPSGGQWGETIQTFSRVVTWLSVIEI